MQVLTDPAECGPVTLALCQDVQAEAYDYPESFFAERMWTPRRPRRTRNELARRWLLKGGEKPLIIAGGGVLYSARPEASSRASAERTASRSAETQAGKSSLPHDHPLNMAAVGVTGTSAPPTGCGRRGRCRAGGRLRACRTSPPARGRCSADPE
jgi:3D-(3,5/4)-trihydroxycyclohexane-1,2-dione acylhydrolase (decyclizing)